MFDVDDSIIYSTLTRGVGVFKHVHRQMLATLSNYYDSTCIYTYSAVCEIKKFFCQTFDTMLSVTFVIMKKS